METAELILLHDVLNLSKLVELNIEHICDTLGLRGLVVLSVDLWILSLELPVLLLQDLSLLLVILWEGILFVFTKPLIDFAVLVGDILHEVQDLVLLHRKGKPRYHKHLDVCWLEVIDWIQMAVAIVVGLAQVGHHLDVGHL